MSRWLRIRPLLAEAWPHLFGLVIVVGGALASGYLLPRGSPTLPVRFAGFVLQLLGIVAVAVGIGDRQKHFHQRGWFSRLWGALQTPRHATANVQLGGLGVSGAGIVAAISQTRPESLEDRLAALEQAHEKMRQDVRAQFDEVRTSIRNAETKVAEEHAERSKVIARLREDLQSVTAGGVHIEKAGLAWLVFGTLFSAFPEEIVLWLSAAANYPTCLSIRWLH